MTSSLRTDRPRPVHAATTLALWVTAWQGGADPDSVLAALRDTDFPRGLRTEDEALAARLDIPGPGEAHPALVEALPLWRESGPARLVLPVPGDVHGLAGAPRLLGAALDAGAAVVFPSLDYGLVPMLGHWRAYSAAAVGPEWSLREARRLVHDAVADATAELDRLDVASGDAGARAVVRDEMLRRQVRTPAGMPPVAAELLASAIALDAVLAVARARGTAAVTAGGLAAVDGALAPLAATARHARRSATAAMVREWHGARAGAAQRTLRATGRPD